MKFDFLNRLQIHQRTSVYLLCVLCAINFGIVLLALFNATLQPEIPMLSLDLDGSLAEYFQYFEELSIALILLGLAIRRRDGGLLLWGLLFLYLFIDDGFSIHENMGLLIEGAFQSVASINLSVHIYEMLFSMMVAAVFLLSIVFNCFRQKSVYDRAITYDLVFLLGLIGFFGVFVDVLHVILGSVWWMYLLFTVVEEAGELFTFSLILVYVYQLARSNEGEGVLVIQPIAHRLYMRYIDPRRG